MKKQKFQCRFLLASMLLIGANQANAIEANLALHQASESQTQGFSFSVADKFSKSSDFYWTVGYSNLDDVKVEWNNDELFFKVDTIDAMVSYRYSPKTYNAFMKKVSFDFQTGVSFALTENKFVWPELNEEKFFTEKNDINAMLGFAVNYDLSKQSAVNIGFKYQPSFSELDDITSMYIGFTYRFGKQVGY